MAYYAFLNDENIVTEVIPGKDENELIDGITPEQWYSEFRNQKCLRTSFNTNGGIHALGQEPFRKNFASVGDYYDQDRDAFYIVQPYPSWILDEETCQWSAPVPFPDVQLPMKWNESLMNWEIDSE